METLAPRLIIFENVPEFPIDELLACLPSFRLVWQTLLCPSELGIPIRRPRRKATLAHRRMPVASLLRAGSRTQCKFLAWAVPA